jgi:predicted ATPase/DNA-binding SARP family transcriptional activator
VEFRLLGPLEVLDGARLLTPARPKQRALLALLLLRAGEVVTPDDAIEALWGERPPPAARNALQGHVAALRKLLGPDRIETRNGGYLLRVGDGEFDLDRFERLVTAAEGRDPRARAEILRDALTLFRGLPLEDFRYESFATAEAARIDELRFWTLEEQIEAELELGRHAEIVPELERLVGEEPLRERAHAQLMLALYRSGRQADALEAYQRARRLLIDEVGIEPSPSLQRLERRILNQDPELELHAAGSQVRRVHLPAPVNPLLGRDRELAAVSALVDDQDVRLVTLTGPGGVGKTRLALELARAAAGGYERGTFFVPLAQLADPALVLPTVARIVGIPETPSRSMVATIGAFLGGGSTLVVLDNFEHVIDAAGDVADLLAAAPGLTLLVTSREALRLTAEHRYPVRPLAENAATSLFLARARAVRPGLDESETTLATVGEICRRLDYLPLSIELAAARMTLFSPQALLERLDERLQLLTEGFRDQPERQQTLKSTLEWSYELLTPDEQRLFCRLAVFAGGWTMDAADAVCGRGLDVVASLSSLVDKSLLQVNGTEVEPRPMMLETIREYANERLEEWGEVEEVRRRHADYFLALAEEAAPQLPLSSPELLDRLEREHDNLRAAFDWFEAAGETQLALRLAGALWRFWYLRAHLDEGRRRLESALSADGRPTLARARCLNGAGAMAMNARDFASATARSEEGLALHEALGDRSGAAYAGFMLGNALTQRGDVAAAQRLYEESVRIFREIGDQHYALLASRHLAFAYETLGDPERARWLHEDNLRRARSTRNARMEATSLGALAHYAFEERRVEDAAGMLVESLRIHRELRDVLDTAVDLSLFARVLAARGKAEAAVELVSSLEALGGEIGARRGQVAETNEETLTIIRKDLDPAVFAAAWERGRALSLDRALALALAD